MDVDGSVRPDNRPPPAPFGEAGSIIKRKRLEASNSPVNVDLSRLSATGTSNDSNRFKILGLLDIETNTDNNVDYNAKQKERTEKNSGKQKKTFCPPIFLYNVNVNRLVEQLETKSPKIEFKIKNVNKYKSKLYHTDVAVHTEMMELLREKEIKSYSFTPKELKQVSLVLRGLYHGSDTEEIKTSLDNIAPQTVAKITKFTTAHSIKKKQDTGLFLVTLLPGKTLSDVANIKYICSQTVVWEKPLKKENTFQCHRCQRWGHIARYCNSQYKCVKCDKQHGPGECSHIRSEDVAPFCVNCGTNGHPASWKGCPSYKDYITKRKERLSKAIEEKSTAAHNVRRVVNASLFSPGKSFASLFKNQSPQNPCVTPSKTRTIDEFMKLTSYFLQPEELTLEQEISMFLTEYKNMTTTEAKTEFLRLFRKVQSVYGP